MPVFCVKIGNRCLNKPESCVEVVEATMIDFSCAKVCPAKKTTATKTTIKANMVFRNESKTNPLSAQLGYQCVRSNRPRL